MRTAAAFVGELRSRLAHVADPQRAASMAAYMRHQFPFYGIDAATRRTIIREVQQQLGLPAFVMDLAHQLWQHDERELQYAACDILVQPRVLKTLSADDVATVAALITQKSWWDTVDCLAPNVIGIILRPLPDLMEQWAREWIASDNIWLQRTAIIMQLRYRQQTNASLLFRCIEQRATSTEFFVRKGAGWALRQYAYVEPARVQHFVETHRDVLSGLTVREALKRIRT